MNKHTVSAKGWGEGDFHRPPIKPLFSYPFLTSASCNLKSLFRFLQGKFCFFVLSALLVYETSFPRPPLVYAISLFSVFRNLLKYLVH